MSKQFFNNECQDEGSKNYYKKGCVEIKNAIKKILFSDIILFNNVIKYFSDNLHQITIYAINGLTS